MEEIKGFIDNLKDEIKTFSEKVTFLEIHKFNRESDFLREKISTINTIIHELESVTKGETKGINSVFRW